MTICGDISLNPGPVKNPCGKCSRPVAKTHRAVQCEACYYWLHIKCEGISPAEYTILCGDDDPWICNNCLNFQFSDSFFENDVSTASEINDSVDCDIFEQLSSARRKHPTDLFVPTSI